MGEMPFGKYRGWRLGDVPTDYLEWLIDSVELRTRLRDQVVGELRRRTRTRSSPPPGRSSLVSMADVLRGWFKRLALKYHPDRGGSDSEMRVVNDALASLRDAIKKAGGEL